MSPHRIGVAAAGSLWDNQLTHLKSIKGLGEILVPFLLICPVVIPLSHCRAPSPRPLSAPWPAGTLTPGTPHKPAFLKPDSIAVRSLKAFSLKDKSGEGQRVLRSYACFFFLFLSPSGADRPDFFLFYSTFWQAPFFSDRKKK